MRVEEFWEFNRNDVLEKIPDMTFEDLQYTRSLVRLAAAHSPPLT
jgi:hypothetical protein